MPPRPRREHSARIIQTIDVPGLVKLLQANARGKLKKRGPDHVDKNGRRHKTSVPMELSESRQRSAIFLIERVIPKAEAPKDLNLDLVGSVSFTFDDPTQRPAGYKRRKYEKTPEAG